MSAPPLLRPLRAILQRRLHIVSSRPIRTPHLVRTSYYRHQLRYNSSVPPDQPTKPEDSAEDASNEQTPDSETPPTATLPEDTQNAAAKAPAADDSARVPDAEQPVTANFHIAGQGDALPETAIPRLDSLRVKSAFQQLKSTDAEIQAGIAEAVARQLEADDATAGGEGEVLGAAEPAIQAMGGQAEGHIVQEVYSLPATEEVVDVGSEHASKVAESAAPRELAQEEVVPEAVTETISRGSAQQEPVQQAASPKTPSPANASAPAQPAAPPGLEALMQASPDHLAAMMAYLQTLQAAKDPAAPVEAAKPEPAIPEAPKEQQQVSAPVESESSTPAAPSADAVAAMAQPAEPAELEPQTPQTAETPTFDPTPAEDVLSEPLEDEDDFVVDPIPDILTPEEEAIRATAQDSENVDEPAQAVVEPESEAASEIASATESSESVVGDPAVDVTDSAKQADTLESVVAAERAASGSQHEGLSVDSFQAAVEEERAASGTQDGSSSLDSSLEAAVDEELEKNDRKAYAAELLAVDEMDKFAAEQGLKFPAEEEVSEPSRLPRNVAAYYLQPLRRVAEYGVPACDLQLRSYSIRPLESFCDFALRAAYYLGLPAYGPVPLPKIIERWTVPRSHFIFKKSQENFERITRRRLIQIKDGNPETVQIWLAFLQKHQQAAVGLKANLWEFSSIDVAKQLDEAYQEAEPLINDKFRLLVQNKEFQTVEKVDELLQSERYRLTGDRVERNQ